jgi:metal-responsive CopG/Arc/MetJ family transcriptional regulator
MEVISLKLDENMLHNIDNSLSSNNFSTRTEFIRAAIREKLDELDKEEAIKQFLALKGKAKIKTSDKERERVGELAFEQLLKEHKMR